MGGINRGEAIEIGWKAVIDQLPVEPEGYSSATEIAKKIGCRVDTVRRKLKKSGVATIKGLDQNGNRVTYYKD